MAKKKRNVDINLLFLKIAATAIVILLAIIGFFMQRELSQIHDDIDRNTDVMESNYDELSRIRHLTIEAHPEIARVLLTLAAPNKLESLTKEQSMSVFEILINPRLHNTDEINHSYVFQALDPIESLSNAQRVAISTAFLRTGPVEAGVVWSESEIEVMLYELSNIRPAVRRTYTKKSPRPSIYWLMRPPYVWVSGLLILVVIGVVILDFAFSDDED